MHGCRYVSSYRTVFVTGICVVSTKQMDYNIHKICRVCLEEGALTSIYSAEFAMAPYTMMMIVSKVRIYESDGLPAVICNNCIYRLGVAYHFKKECENSDIRLRQYLGLPDRGYSISDAETNTDITIQAMNKVSNLIEQMDKNSEEDDDVHSSITKKNKRRNRYQRKPAEDHKKRGPKPLPKLPHTCYECHKVFKCSAQLQTHMRIHTGEKPFSCGFCTRSFAQKYNLHIHERTHSGYKPYQCEICSRQFSALGNFQAHQKIHAGVRDQICPVCQKSFYSAGDLTKHMATHTGLKNHHCDLCGKSFSRQRDMRAHKRKMHAVREHVEEDDGDDSAVDAAVNVVGNTTGGVNDIFRCPDCDKEFSSAGGLSVHFRIHSSNNLLNLPLSSGQLQMPPPPVPVPPPPATHHPHHHPHHHHHYDVLHHSHLQMNATGPLQTNPTSGMAMLMHHHAPPNASGPPGPGQNTTLSLMHATQRLHPY